MTDGYGPSNFLILQWLYLPSTVINDLTELKTGEKES